MQNTTSNYLNRFVKGGKLIPRQSGSDQMIETYPQMSSKPKFSFIKKGDKLFAECSANRKLYPINQYIFHILPNSDFDLSIEATIRELLKQNYIPSLQNDRLIWTHPTQSVAKNICDFLAQAKLQTIGQKFDEAICTLLEAQKMASEVDDPLGEAHFLEKIDRKWLDEINLKSPDKRVERLLLQKDAVRRTFEMFLITLSKESPQHEKPNCFVCFSLGENDVTEWLEETFIPDLNHSGIEPLVCFKQFGPGKDLNTFQKRIRTAERVAIICTHSLKQKCNERADAPQGVVQEIRLAENRIGDEKLNETTYPVYLKGDYATVCPSEYFESILGINFTLFDRCTPAQLFTYYGATFELFGSMRAIDRHLCRKIRKMFIEKTKEILKYNKIDEQAVLEWRYEKERWKIKFKSKLEQTVIRDLASSSIQRENINLNIPFPNFIGREAILKQLTPDFSKWKPTHPTQVRILIGPAGIGKTELSIKFANDFLEQFSLVWFIRMETPGLFERDYLNLAKALHIDTQNLPFDEIKRRVHQNLESRDLISQPWLLIYDHVETKFEIPARGGFVLVTSQYKNIWDTQDDFISVPPFTTHQDIIQLFKKYQINLPEQCVESLVVRFEGFPILLEQIAKYLSKTRLPIEKYLQQVRLDEVLWRVNDNKRYPNAMGQVLKKNLGFLKTSNGDAYEFIKFCAYLNIDSFSLKLLEFWCNEVKKPNISEKILEIFQDFNLINFRIREGFYFFIFPFFQEVFFHNTIKELQEQDYFSTVKIIYSLYSHSKKNDTGIILIEHIKDSDEFSAELTQLLIKLRLHSCWSRVSNPIAEGIKKVEEYLFKQADEYVFKCFEPGSDWWDAAYFDMQMAPADFSVGCQYKELLNFRMAQKHFFIAYYTYLSILRYLDKCVSDVTQSKLSIHNAIGFVLIELQNSIEALQHFMIAFKGIIQIKNGENLLYFKNTETLKYFNDTIKCLLDLSDKAFALKMKQELLQFCLQECGPTSEYVVKLKNLQLNPLDK